jgi:hypothetical protein
MLTLPCTPRDLLHEVIVPALAFLPVHMDSRDARCMLLAISKQESDLEHVRQGGNGPARSLWQFERMGVLGVTMNHRVDDLAAICCREAKIACAASIIMKRIEVDHLLACRLARLNLWTDRLSLPKADLHSEESAWQCYRRVWRPGAAKEPGSERYNDARARWHNSWRIAVETVSQ